MTPDRTVIAAAVVLAAAIGFIVGVVTDEDTETADPAAQRAAPSTAASESELRRELETLGSTRAAGLRRLRAASTPRRQAAASDALARAYRSAATAARREPTNRTPPGESIVEALRGAATAYRRLGAGAASDDRAAYNAGRRAVRRAEGLLVRSLDTSPSPDRG